jgi:urease accessory protein
MGPMPMDIDRGATDQAAFLMLLNWMSPTFPIGSFAYSHGLEQAIADGRLSTQDDVADWISELLRHGSGWNDAVMFAQCWHGNPNEIALALAGSKERYAETTQLGRNFNIAAAVWTDLEQRSEIMAYPVAAGLACKRMNIPKDQALSAFLQGFCAALVSVAVRLVPLGQTSGLMILRKLAPQILAMAQRAISATPGDIGGHCIAADIAAMRHETLEPRIFRT